DACRFGGHRGDRLCVRAAGVRVAGTGDRLTVGNGARRKGIITNIRPACGTQLPLAISILICSSWGSSAGTKMTTSGHSAEHAAQPVQTDDLTTQEAQARLAKLQLEQQALKRQVSWHGLALEWFKAASVPATLVGILLTFLTQTETIKQGQSTRDSER